MTCNVGTDSNVQLDSLLRHMAVHVPEIPYVVALDLVRERYIEFARKSGLLIYHQELPIQRDVTNYFLKAPDEYEVFSVKAVGHPSGWTWFNANVHHWFSMWGYRFWVKDNTEVVFERAPSTDEADRFVLLGVIPSPCCATIPASVATPYGSAIAAGAVATALLMPGKAWTNPALANVHEMKFNRAVLSGRNLAITNRGSVTPELKPVRIL